MIVLPLALAGLYLACSAWTARRLQPNDVECATLDLKPATLSDRWASEFPGTGPRPPRYPWRLPGEYVVWWWSARLRHPLLPARIAGTAVGAVGVVSGGWWVWQRTASPLSLALYGLTIATSPGLMAGLTSATYVPWVSTLWMLGLLCGSHVPSPGRDTDARGRASGGTWLRASGSHLRTGYLARLLCGVALALLRPTAWWQAGWLLRGWAPVLAGYLAWRHPGVVRSQGWARLLRREPCPVQGIVHDGWGYAAKVALSRYGPVATLAVLAALVGTPRRDSVQVLALSAGLFAATHAPRARLRPKWCVGYLPEWGVPVVAALAGMIGPLRGR